MKKKNLKKTMATMLSGACIVSGVVVPTDTAYAGAGLGYWPEDLPVPNQYYYQNESLQPYGTCLQVGELKNWSPDNDPDARYNRSAIPLQERYMGPNVNPLASRDAKIMPLAMSNARASEAPSQGGDGDFVYAFNNFQYVDTYNFWGGSSAEGPIAIPSPEHIDSAHRNGVMATGTIFIPWGDEEYGSRFVRELTEKDSQGNYPCADKLIEIAQYYGFDGYIFNAESGTGVEGFKEFLIYMQKKAPENFRISWYNGRGTLGEGDIQSWMQDGENRITDEWWLDMSGSGNVDGTIDAAYGADRDKWDIHSTWEYIPMEDGAKGGDYQARLDKDGKLKISLGILAPTSTLTQSKNSDDFMNVQDQELWVGPDFDPTSTNRPENEFCGFANLVADQTPIIGTDFVTHFNPGNGYKFYENGAVTGKEEGWHNRSLTEVLPTWRWIVDAEDGASKVTPKIDYEDAYWGGASLKMNGDLTAGKANHIKLYSTQLDIQDNSTFELIYKTKKNSDVKLSVGLCFGDTYNEENFEFYPVEIKGNGKWQQASIPLANKAGEKAIAISLKLESAKGVKDYDINIGKMGVVTDKAKPEAPGEITLDDVIYPTDMTAEARIYWDKGEKSFIDMIHRVRPDGEKEFVGATPSDAFYIPKFKKLKGETEAVFEITSISKNGVEGASRQIKIQWPEEVPNGYGPEVDLGTNLALRAPAVTDVSCAADGPVDKINDGVIPSSKWCGLSTTGSAYIDLGKEMDISRWVVYHANCRGAGEGVSYNTVDFELLYAGDDKAELLDPSDEKAAERVKNLKYKEADTVKGNKQNITDRNIKKPVKARYIKLHVTKSDNTPWSAIRIYEFQLYGKAGEGSVAVSPSPLERNVTVYNNKGEQDKVIIDNVSMLYSEGAYPNGSVNEKTGVVSLYESMDAKEPIAQVRAQQPDNLYKQYATGVATFDNVKLNPNGGRLWYSVQDASTGEVVSSQRTSVAYPPETGEKILQGEAKLFARTGGVNLENPYGTLEIKGLEENAVVKVYADEKAEKPILTSAPAGKDQTIILEEVPLTEAGGKVFYTIHAPKKPDTERLTLDYGKVSELPAYQTDLVEMANMYERNFNESDFIASTWGAFGTARSNVTALIGKDVTKAQADQAREALKSAESGLLRNADKSRILEVCAEYEANKDHYSKESWEAFKPVLDSVNAFAKEDVQTDKMTIQTQRVKLDKAARELVEIVPVDGAIIPDEALLNAIKEQTGCSSVEELAKYQGELDLTNLPVKDLTGLEKLENLKGLTLTGTKVKEVYGKNLPKTLEKLNMSGCAELETIDLSEGGFKNLKEADISGCEKLVLVYMNSVGLEKLNVSKDGKYEKVYAVDLSGNRLDFSKGTPERGFVNKVEENLKKNPPKTLYKYNNVSTGKDIKADEMAGRHEDPKVMVDGNKAPLSGSYYLDNKGTATINLGKVEDISKVAVTYKEKEFASQYKWEYSENGKNFKELVTVSDNKKPNAEDVLNKPVKAQYLKYTTVNKGKGEAVILELEAFTRNKIESVVKYTEQSPVLVADYKTIPAEIQLAQGSDAVRIQDYMDKCYKEAKTVRGNGASALKDQKWLAKGYNVDAMTKVPEGMKVVIADKDGAVYEDPFHPQKAGAYTVKFTLQDETVLATMTIKVSADKEALNILIEECKNKTEKDYTPATWKIFAEQLKAAQTVAEKEYATQEEVDNAEKALFEAMYQLERKAEKTVLTALIKQAQGLDLSGNTPNSVEALEQALALAVAVRDDVNATQAQVTEATNALTKAMNELLPIADKSKLEELIKQAEALNKDNYTSATVKNFEEMLKAAKAIAGDQNAFEEDVDLAYKNLLQAMAGLELKVNTAELKNMIASAEKILAEKDRYIPGTLEGLEESLEAAKNVLKNENATQEQVNQAASDLSWKVGNARIKANKKALQGSIKKASKVDISLYTEETARVFSGALARASQVEEDEYATQEEVDSANANLENAMDGLVKIEQEKPSLKPEKPENEGNSQTEEENNAEPEKKPEKEENPVTPSKPALSKKPVSSTKDYAVHSRRQENSSSDNKVEVAEEKEEQQLASNEETEEDVSKEVSKKDTEKDKKVAVDSETVKQESKQPYIWIGIVVVILAGGFGLWWWKKKHTRK